MKIRSRPTDPLEEGQSYLAYVYYLLEHEYEHSAQEGTVRLTVQIADGVVTTVITFINLSGDTVIQRHHEPVEDFVW